MASPWQLQFPHLKTRLGHLLETKVLSDCSFLVGREGLVIAGHKVIIGMASPVLYEKIEKDPLQVVIADVEPDVFQDMLRYIYTDEVTISCSDTAYRLCKAAQIYQLPQLEKMCYHHISTDLTTKNVMQVYELAVCHKDDILTEKCEEILKTQTKKVLKESSFKSACLDAVVAMFSLDKLDVDSEIELLRALDRIANNENRKPSDNECETSTVRDALEKIRFLSLTPEEFAEGKAGLTVLPAHDACAVLANLVSSKSGLPMPENFCLMREPRKKRLVPVSEIKFQHRFEDFIKNKYNLNQLWVHNKVQDVPWKVHFNLEDHEDVLSFYAYCNWEEKTRDWSCNAEVCIKLIRSGNLDPLVKKYTHQFKRSSSNWGLPDIISWCDLVDPENKYLHDGALILEVTIKAEELIYLPKD